jgi:hypothetical protein
MRPARPDTWLAESFRANDFLHCYSPRTLVMMPALAPPAVSAWAVGFLRRQLSVLGRTLQR